MKRTAALILSMILLCGCSASQQPAATTGTGTEQGSASQSEQEMYAQDAQQLVYAVEACHPAFALEGLIPPDYDKASKEFLKSAKKANSLDEFEVLVNNYLALMDDTHTAIVKSTQPDGEGTLQNIGKYSLDLKVTEKGNVLYLADENGKSTGETVTSVGGVSTEVIFGTISKMFPSENMLTDMILRGKYALDKQILAISGCDTEKDTIEVVCSNGTLELPFVETQPEKDTVSDKTAEAKMIGDILYLDVNSFASKDEDFVAVTDKAREFVQNGGSKVIIDVRKNIGGDDKRLNELLSALDMSVPVGRMIERHSKSEWESIKKDPKASTEDKTYSETPSSSNLSKANPNVDLVVICDYDSKDISVALCSGVQNGGLGKVIGRPPMNSLNFYLAPMEYELPNTHIPVTISSAYRYRNDESAFQQYFVPDEMPAANEDLLEYTVKNHFGEEYTSDSEAPAQEAPAEETTAEAAPAQEAPAEETTA